MPQRIYAQQSLLNGINVWDDTARFSSRTKGMFVCAACCCCCKYNNRSRTCRRQICGFARPFVLVVFHNADAIDPQVLQSKPSNRHYSVVQCLEKYGPSQILMALHHVGTVGYWPFLGDPAVAQRHTVDRRLGKDQTNGIAEFDETRRMSRQSSSGRDSAILETEPAILNPAADLASYL